MNIIHSFVLGVVEGVTEFLPISSTAHLIITSKLVGISQTEFIKFFEVFIQSGAILSVVIMYFKFLLNHKELVIKIFVSFIPTAVIGFILQKLIKNVFFESYYLIIGSMSLIGVAFLVFEFLVKKEKISLKKSIKDLSYKEAFFTGLGQSLAVVPGVSRAGIVMLTMMGQGYKRSEAAMYSFMLAIPTIFAASLFDLIKFDLKQLSDNSNLLFLIVGFITSFIFAYISISWLIDFLKKNSLIIFGVYRIILAITLLLFLR